MDVGENEEVRDHRRLAAHLDLLNVLLRWLGYLVSGTRTSIGDFLTKN